MHTRGERELLKKQIIAANVRVEKLFNAARKDLKAQINFPFLPPHGSWLSFPFTFLVTVASTPESILNKTDSIALGDLSTEATSSTNVQTEAQSKNGQISSEFPRLE